MAMEIKEIQSKKLITAIKTPYLLDGQIDIETFDRLVDRQIKLGVEGIVVGGTTGEGHLLSWDEHLMLIAHAAHAFGKKLLIIGNTGSNNTKESYNATYHGFLAGMDCALLINPYYGKTSKDGLLLHFNKVLELGPAIIYNVPARTAQDITPEVMIELARGKNFVGVKECMGNQRILEYWQRQIFCWSGVDEQAGEAVHKHHALGVVSVAANVIPSQMSSLLAVANEELDQSLQPFFRWLSSEPNPIPLNSILADMRLIKPSFRMPYCHLSFEQRELGLKLLAKIDQKMAHHPLKDELFILN